MDLMTDVQVSYRLFRFNLSISVNPLTVARRRSESFHSRGIGKDVLRLCISIAIGYPAAQLAIEEWLIGQATELPRERRRGKVLFVTMDHRSKSHSMVKNLGSDTGL